MKIRKALLALVGVSTLMTAVSAKPADAASIHRLKIDGFMDITDDEVRNDEHCNDLPIQKETSVDHGANNLAQVHYQDYCGGEVRIEVALRATLVGEQFCGITLTVSLYEGTWILNNDLDGISQWKPASSVCFSAGQRFRFDSLRVDNTTEGGDHAELELNIRHLT